MKKQINKLKQSLLLAAIAVFVVLGASGSALAQTKKDNYPKPDFTVMEEGWEIVEWEYDFTENIPAFYVIAKPKQKTVSTWFTITWRDAKGVRIDSQTIVFDYFDVQKAKIGEPIRGRSYAPWKRQMPQVKSIIVTEHESPHDQKVGN